MTLQGIDLASHQGRYDFATAKREGREFAIIKVSGGHSYQNPERDQQITRAREAGMTIGLYHYMFEASSGGGDVAREFANFKAAAQPYALPGTTLWLDCEDWPSMIGFTGSVCQFILDFAALCRAEFGCPCGVYTGSYYILGTDMRGDRRLATLPLWIASWQDVVPGSQYLAPWDRAAVWQNDAYTTVAGQQTDTDVFFGTREDFQALGVPFVAATVTDQIAKGINVVGEPHPDGMLSPVTATFLNPDEPGQGIPYKLGLWVWNPEERKHYYGEWEMGAYKPWQELG